MEIFIIAFANTGADPWTMMVKLLYTIVTFPAVRC